MLLFSDPSVDGPIIQFRDGQTHGTQIQIPSAAALISSLQSQWHLQQWNKSQPLDPAAMFTAAANTFDDLYGLAAYSWQTANRVSEFQIYQQAGSYIYNLVSRNGDLYNSNGSNLFLESAGGGPQYTFDHPISYSLSARMTAAGISYDPRFSAASSTTVVAQAFTGFTVVFNDPGNPNYQAGLGTFGAFMQIGITDSRGDVATLPEYIGSSAGAPIDNWTSPTDPRLAFAASEQPLRTLAYSLNQHLQHMLDGNPELTAAEHNLSLWSLSSLYVGLETQNADGTPGSPVQDVDQGQVLAGIEVSSIEVSYDPSQLYTGAPATAAIVQDRMVAYMDGSAQLGGVIEAATYVGPVAYLSSQLLYAGPDNMAYAAATPNVFIQSGSGNDAIAVQSGHNVLDGGTGSNFLTGGSGIDTFFVDARAAETTWDTVVDFHAGDAATLWGFVPSSSRYWWDGISGAPGSEGATLRMDLHGTGVSASITFAGLSMSQASGLVITTGAVAAGPYLWIYHPGA